MNDNIDYSIVTRLRMIVDRLVNTDPKAEFNTHILEEDLPLCKITELIIFHESIIRKESNNNGIDTLYFDYETNKQFLESIIIPIVDEFRKQEFFYPNRCNVVISPESYNNDQKLINYINDFHFIRNSFVHGSLEMDLEKHCYYINNTHKPLLDVTGEDIKNRIKNNQFNDFEYICKVKIPFSLLEDNFHSLSNEKTARKKGLIQKLCIGGRIKELVNDLLRINKQKSTIVSETTKPTTFNIKYLENIDPILKEKALKEEEKINVILEQMAAFDRISEELWKLLNEEMTTNMKNNIASKNSQNKSTIFFLYQYMLMLFLTKKEELASRYENILEINIPFINDSENDKEQQEKVDKEFSDLSKNHKINLGRLKMSKLHFTMAEESDYHNKVIRITSNVKHMNERLDLLIKGYITAPAEKQEKIMKIILCYIRRQYYVLLNEMADKNMEVIRCIRNSVLHSNIDINGEKVVLKDMNNQNEPNECEFILEDDPIVLYEVIKDYELERYPRIHDMDDSIYNSAFLEELQSIIPNEMFSDLKNNLEKLDKIMKVKLLNSIRNRDNEMGNKQSSK